MKNYILKVAVFVSLFLFFNKLDALDLNQNSKLCSTDYSQIVNLFNSPIFIQENSSLTPAEIGLLHNAYLNYLNQNINLEGCNNLNTLDLKSLELIYIYNENNTHLDKSCLTNSYFLRTNIYTPQNFKTINIKDKGNEYIEQFKNIPNILNNNEAVILLKMFEEINNSKELKKEEAYDKINKAITEAIISHDLLNLNNSNHEGFVSMTAIQVAKNSLQFWTNYEYDKDMNPCMPLWVGMDAVGALCGAGSSLLQNHLNHQAYDWNGAAAWGLGGALGASIPSTKWFKAVFH
jgi:hypothetical protein